jgi:hypothetical protein
MCTESKNNRLTNAAHRTPAPRPVSASSVARAAPAPATVGSARESNRLTAILLIGVLALGMYLGAYFGLVRFKFVGWADGPHFAPAYARLPAPLNSVAGWAFAPAHRLDRQWLRPQKWDGTRPLSPSEVAYYP